jgi:hypothetical protein
MASTNKKTVSKRITHEGAKASNISAKQELERTVMTCMLWENNFYEDGVSVADRIKDLVPKVSTKDIKEMAIKARNEQKLRHVPLLLVREMARSEKHRSEVADTLQRIIQRPDELTEFLSIYWKEGKTPVANQIKKGLAKAFKKFNEYSLAKYNRKNTVTLKDVLFISHPKPDNDEQQDIWNRLVKDELKTPDTWEVEISGKGNNKDSWVRLLSENKLGSLALLRNLRNMIEKNVPKTAIKNALNTMKIDRVLPFRFLSAAKYAPDLEPELEQLMFKSVIAEEKIKGKTVILVDVSGSMDATVSAKSELTRLDAAYGVAILAREICDDVSIFTFSNQLCKMAPRRGFALKDLMHNSQDHGGTAMGAAINATFGSESDIERMIVITDEQSQDAVPNCPKNVKGYIINVSPDKNGVGYGSWIHINGWSESCVNFIRELEKD